MRTSQTDHERDEELERIMQQVKVAEQVPQEWIDVADGKRPAEALLAGTDLSEDQVRAIRALFHPLDPRTEASLVAEAVEQFMAAAPAVQPVAAGTEPRRPAPGPTTGEVIHISRWATRIAMGVAALAAAAAALFVVFPRDPGPTTLDGEVSVQAAVLGAAGGEKSLHLRSGAFFFLECHAHGHEIEVVSVRARQDGALGKAYGLAFTVTKATPQGATLHALADLPRGRWSVTCGGPERGSGRFSWFSTGAEIVVQ